MPVDRHPLHSVHRFAKLVVAATFLLIGAGGLVTSTGSGLAVPDWPTTYGYNMFTFPVSRWVGGILYEHGHRLLASTVGMLTIGLAVWLSLVENRRWMKALGWLALGAVILQGILGGLTVRFLLPTPVSVSHACLAKLFFCLLIAIAFFTSPGWFRSGESCPSPVPETSRRGFAFLAGCLTLTVYFQIALGAVMRHTYDREVGFVLSDFPLSNGAWIPEFGDPLIAVHFAHRLTAFLILVVSAILTLWSWNRLEQAPGLRAVTAILTILVLLQGTLGALTVWTEIEDPVSGYLSPRVAVTSLHQWNGALVLGVSFFLALKSFHLTQYGNVSHRVPKEGGAEAEYAFQI